MVDKKGMAVRGVFVVMILGLLFMSLGIVSADPLSDAEAELVITEAALVAAGVAFDANDIDEIALNEVTAERDAAALEVARIRGSGSGVPGVSVRAGTGAGAGAVGGWLSDKYDLWLRGIDWSSADVDEQVDSVGQVIKWFILVLVILLIYSGLSYANFPGKDQYFIRFVLALATGFLATFLITTKELLTALQSYTAMGIALTVFFPIFVLGLFSMVVITKAKPMGIFLQNILWIIYSVYLFARTGIYLVLKNAAEAGTLVPGTPYPVLGFIDIDINTGVIAAVNAYSGPMLITLFITSIAIFFIMVIGNRYIRGWVDEHLRASEVDARASELSRSSSFTKQNADQMRDQT